jgi:hypothetical protein
MTDPTQTAKPASSKPMKKLTRAQITQGLEQFPVEVLLSSGKGKQAQLTTKQREFAHGLALGKTKAQAYRDSRPGKPAPSTIVTAPYKLATNARIQLEVEAYKLAIEAEKHRTPAQLKSLLVQQLVQHSLDQDFPPAQRVQCLKLLGTLFEVGAFVERKEVTTVNRSGDIRARILETLKDVTDVAALDDGLSLLEEISQTNTHSANAAQADPTGGALPLEAERPVGVTTHTIPLKQSHEKADTPPSSLE